MQKYCNQCLLFLHFVIFAVQLGMALVRSALYQALVHEHRKVAFQFYTTLLLIIAGELEIKSPFGVYTTFKGQYHKIHHID